MDSDNYKEIISMYAKCIELLVNISNTQNTIIKILDRVQERMQTVEDKYTKLNTRVDKIEETINYAV